MSNELTIGIVGLYTLVYVIVFFVQKSQLEKQKEVISSMKSFMDIFKIDEVKKYVEMKNELIIDRAVKMVKDEGKIDAKLEELVKGKADEITKLHMESLGDQYDEMFDVVSSLLLSMNKEETENLINSKLSKSKHIFECFINENENNDI
jgi:hypothetical protein